MGSSLTFPSPGHLPNQGIKPRSPTLQADSLPAEPPGKPKNTGVGSLSLLQGIFPTQESNQGLLHCRQILYQLNYQRSPDKTTGQKEFYRFFFFNKGKHHLPYSSVTEHLGTPKFIAASFVIASNWKQPKCLPADDALWHTHIMEY